MSIQSYIVNDGTEIKGILTSNNQGTGSSKALYYFHFSKFWVSKDTLTETQIFVL